MPYALHVDSGLNRFGLRLENVEKNALIFKEYLPVLMMSHLSCADVVGHFMNQRQVDLFEKMRSFLPDVPLSFAASDGLFLGSDFTYDLTRAGAALYGINTTPYRENKMKPVIQIQAPLLSNSEG